jgi:hypothetical protein
MGPKIIRTEAPEPTKAEAGRARREQRQREQQTGIRRTLNGWAAIRKGRLIAEYTGLGAQPKAIQTAGTNRRLP